MHTRLTYDSLNKQRLFWHISRYIYVSLGASPVDGPFTNVGVFCRTLRVFACKCSMARQIEI
jgi:hypothetical protein